MAAAHVPARHFNELKSVKLRDVAEQRMTGEGSSCMEGVKVADLSEPCKIRHM